MFYLLSLLAIFIWVRDLSWASSSDDTLPIIIALPLFIWLGAPWKWRSGEIHYSIRQPAVGIFVFVLGIGLNLTLLLTAGWVILLNAWLSERLQKESLQNFHKLLILPIMAFPWISLDLNQIGWWFRLSGAWVTEQFFKLIGLSVAREGTLLNIDGLPISIEAACAGLNTLQAMLISGSVIAYILLKDSNRYWLSLPLLIVMSWIANTFRIIVICVIALIAGADFVMGSFHVWSGWGVITLMFFLCWGVFSLMEPDNSSKKPTN